MSNNNLSSRESSAAGSNVLSVSYIIERDEQDSSVGPEQNRQDRNVGVVAGQTVFGEGGEQTSVEEDDEEGWEECYRQGQGYVVG